MKEEKIWGFTEEIFANRLFEFHRLEYKKGFNCSEHIHKYKWNAFYIESGKMIVRVWNSKSDLEDYDSGLMIGETQETTEDSEKPTIDSSTYIRSHTYEER